MQAAEMGGCREMDMWQLQSLVSREGVSSLALLFRGPGQLLLSNLHVVGGPLSWHNSPDFQKCCYLAGQRFLNQLIKRKHLLSNG